MLTFHQFLDKIFKKQISFSIFFRIWLTFAVLIIMACSFALYYTQKTLRPSAKRVVEDDLADTDAKFVFERPEAFFVKWAMILVIK